MSAFSVEVEQVGVLADRLVRAGEELAAAGRTLEPAGDWPGLPGLAGAVEEFSVAWRRSLERTGRSAQEAGVQLRRSAEAYRRVDAAVARACG